MVKTSHGIVVNEIQILEDAIELDEDAVVREDMDILHDLYLGLRHNSKNTDTLSKPFDKVIEQRNMRCFVRAYLQLRSVS